MELEITKSTLINSSITFDDKVVHFKNGFATVKDDIGQFVIDNYDYVFRKGTAPIKDVKPPVHVFDETMIEKQANQIVTLNKELEAAKKKIKILEDNVSVWKQEYAALEKRFKELSKTEKPQVVETDLRKELESKLLSEIKEMAEKLEIKPEDVPNKKLKEDWITAIIKKVE